MPAHRVVILDDYQGVALSMTDWSALTGRCAVEVIRRPLVEEDDVVASVGGYDVVVAMRERTRFPATVLERLPALRLLVTTGMRNSSIDLSAATGLGVTVCGTQSYAQPPVELTWALLLGLARGIHLEHEAFRAGTAPWQRTVGADLHGRRLGLLGLGKIGSAVATVGHAFGMHVSAWSSNLSRDRTEELGVELAGSKFALLASSDFVSVHLVLSDRTRGFVGRHDLQSMKPRPHSSSTPREPHSSTRTPWSRP